MRLITRRQRHVGDWPLGAEQLRGGILQTNPADVFPERLAHVRGKDAMKMEPRKTRHAGQLGQLQRFADMLVNVGQHAVDALTVIQLGLASCGGG